MSNYRLEIEYDGGRYKGWQRLGEGVDTVQGRIERALVQGLGQPVEIIGCSRTDAGVHALAQVANFHFPQQLPTAEVQRCLNQHLPMDIAVRSVFAVPEDFHARFHAKGKTYLYKIWNQEYPNPFMRRYSLHVPQVLDLAAMSMAAGHFLGEHDFTAFSNAKSKKKSMVRTLRTVRIEREAGFILIRLQGDGFLHNMARKLVGVLIAVGRGEMAAGEIPEILNARQRGQIGAMADACGLYLESIQY